MFDYWNRLPFIGRLLFTASMALLLAGAVMLFVSARQEAFEVRSDLESALVQELELLPTALAETVVIGDYATLKQSLERFVAQPLISSVEFQDAAGAHLASSDISHDAKAPDWFLSLFNFSDVKGRASIVVGGKNYGELTVTLTANDLSNRAWSRLKGHLGILFLAIVLDFIGIWLVLRQGLAPLKNLQAATHAIAAGNVDIHLNLAGSAELRGVIESFNAMAASVQASQEALRQSKEQLQLAINGVNDGIWDWNLLTNDVYYSPKWKEMLGYADFELPNIFATFEGLLHPDDKEQVTQIISSYLNDEIKSYSIESRFKHKDGSWRWILARGMALRDEQGRPYRMLGSHTDMTERKQLQEDLRNKVNFIDAILQSAGSLIVAIGRDGAIVQFNKAAEDFTGYTFSEVAGQPFFWSRFLLPEQQSGVTKVFESALSGNIKKRYENYWVSRDGEKRLFDWSNAVVNDNEGQMQFLITIGADITERKLHEEDLKRSNDELEQFSYSISHDMRQPLRMISSYMQLLESSLAGGLDDSTREYFSFAIEGAKRMDKMMLGLLEYSRIGRKGEPSSWVESRQLLDDALLFLRPAVSEVNAQVRIEGEWPRVYVSEDEILRLLQNLISNALKFRTAARTPDVLVTSVIDSKAWHVCVSDNGIGIMPDQIGRLFHVFQRLHARSEYEGTGVGLALCRKIAEHHNGSIHAESDGEGYGSRFCVDLNVPHEIAKSGT
jgi:PAS domain S-box-containing protein